MQADGNIIRIGTSPNGTNINDHCGSLYPEVVAAKVRELRADVGLALDGDADRLIVVDEQGNILDGDQLMALCAQSMMARGELPNNLLVATVMSNLALEIFMREHGGTLLRAPVGDRYVVEAMRREGAMLGGGQSGHLPPLQHHGRRPAGRAPDPAHHAGKGKAPFRTCRAAHALSAMPCQCACGKAPAL